MARPRGHRFDDIDFQIISALFENASLTLEELGRLIGKGETACKGRLDFLKEKGFLSIGAHVPREVSKWKDVRLLTVKLPSPDKETLDKFTSHIKDYKEIVCADLIAGTDDVMLRIECEDGARFNEIRLSILETIPGSRAKTTSVVKNIKRARLPPEAILPVDGGS